MYHVQPLPRRAWLSHRVRRFSPPARPIPRHLAHAHAMPADGNRNFSSPPATTGYSSSNLRRLSPLTYPPAPSPALTHILGLASLPSPRRCRGLHCTAISYKNRTGRVRRRTKEKKERLMKEIEEEHKKKKEEEQQNMYHPFASDTKEREEWAVPDTIGKEETKKRRLGKKEKKRLNARFQKAVRARRMEQFKVDDQMDESEGASRSRAGAGEKTGAEEEGEEKDETKIPGKIELPPLGEAYHEFLKWFLELGGKARHVIPFRRGGSDHRRGRRGLLATQSIAEGKTIIYVPVQLFFGTK